MNNDFSIEKEILAIQWTNVRYYWDKANQAVLQMTSVPFLVLFGNLLKGDVQLSNFARCSIKTILVVAVIAFGLLVYKTLENYYQRSLRARTVIIEIERKWKLYDPGGLFSHQDAKDEYRYEAFNHKTHIRTSHQKLQTIYAGAVTVLSVVAVLLLF